MKIGALLHMYPPIHNAGAEHMLHAMLRDMVRRGHEAVVVIDDGKTKLKPYTLDGVKVSTDKRAFKGIDVLLTHLDCTEDAEVWAEKHDVPLVQIFHNHARPTMVKKCDLAVYNAEHLLRHAPMGDETTPTIVLHPPIWREDYTIDEDKHDRRFITLINLQRPKGVEMFYAMAETFPKLEFLGVKGSYGEQVMPPRRLRNVTILDNQTDIRKVYAQTAILLMPSSYESYGRCAVEASCSGIPVIANPTQGLREALRAIDDRGLFPLPDSKSWAAAIEYVRDTYPARVRDARWVAKNLDPDSEMDGFEEALMAVVA